MTAERRVSAEQQARDLLEACGVEDAQNFTAGDVVALANYISEHMRVARENLNLGTWLEEILHVHFHDGCEWETVQKWLDNPKSFDIAGEPFRSEMDYAGKQAIEVARLRAQETRIRAVGESLEQLALKYEKNHLANHGRGVLHARRELLAALDTEEGQA